MSSIFPIRETVSLDTEREPRLVDLDEETADEVFEALASRTTRKIFLGLHETPQTASDLAKETDTTVQNAQYHLGKLVDAELIEVVDTWYSERGSEMKVYAPKDESLVLFAGRDKQHSLRRLLNRVVGVFGMLVPSSALVGLAAHWRNTTGAVADDDASPDDDAGVVPTDDAESTPTGDTDDAPTDDAPDEEQDMGTLDEDEESTEADREVSDSEDVQGDDIDATTSGNDTESFHAEFDNETLYDSTSDVVIQTSGNDEVANNMTEATEAAAAIDPLLAAGIFFLGGLFIFGALTVWYG